MSNKNRLSRRNFIALTGATAAYAAGSTYRLYAAPTPAVTPQPGVQSLAGEWRFALDRDDVA